MHDPPFLMYIPHIWPGGGQCGETVEVIVIMTSNWSFKSATDAADYAGHVVMIKLEMFLQGAFFNWASPEFVGR